jgi:secreted trypsin-like serine protease
LSGKAFAYADQDRAYDAEEPPPPAMGGGYQVTRGDAEWMVELYAVHDYTAKQIEDDEKLPPLQQQHLAERSPEELAHACGGTIIGRDLVLTAAHCVATGRFLPPNESRVFDDRRVRVGSLLIGRGGETRAIVGMVIHQGYTGLGTGLPNDIALLLLKSDEPVRLGVPSLKVASTFPKSGSTLAGLGWGFTQSVARGANINLNGSNQVQHNPQMLQVAQLEVIGATDCNKRVNAKLQVGMLCLVTPRSVTASGGRPTFSCRGDSGGPLVRNYRSSDEELVGLTSWSLGCGDKNTPSVYTDVAYFSRWVDAARKAIRPGAVIRVGDPTRSH